MLNNRSQAMNQLLLADVLYLHVNTHTSDVAYTNNILMHKMCSTLTTVTL